MEKLSNTIDIAIIGAGVAGIYASYCCGISGISCMLFETTSCPGGQCVAFYPDKPTYGIPGFSDVLAADFIDNLKKQTEGFSEISRCFCEKIVSITKSDDGFSLNDGKYFAKYIVIATGIGNMVPNIPIDIPGLKRNDDFVQCYCLKMNLYKNKNVIIAGGGDSAADFAINISNIAQKITIIHRRDAMRCDAHKLNIIKQTPNIEIKLNHNILAINNERQVITDHDTFSADYIIFCYGFRSLPSSITGLDVLGVKTDNNYVIADINTMETDATDIFAIGDAVIYPNKKKNIVSCFFEADRAVRMIKSKMSSRDV